MKIITRGVIDMATGEVLEEEFFEYEGPVALMKGGGGTTQTVQKADPWSGQQPYLTDIFANAQNLYHNYTPQYYQGQTVASRDPAMIQAQSLGLDAAGWFADQSAYAAQNMADQSQANPYQVWGPQINYWGQQPQIQFQGQNPQIDYSGQGGQINFQGQNPQIDFQAQNPFINYGLLEQQFSGLNGGADIPDLIDENGGIAADALQQLLSGEVNTPVYDAVAEAATRRYMNAFEDASGQTIQNLQEQVLPALETDAILAGQYGGSRQGIAEGLAGERAMDDIIREQQRATQAAQDISTQIFGDAYTLAQQLMSRGVDQATALQIANQQTAIEEARLQGQFDNNLAGIYGSLAGQQGQMDLGMQNLLAGLAESQGGLDLGMQQLYGQLAGQQGQLDQRQAELLGQLAGQQGQLDLGMQNLLGGLAESQGQLDLGFEGLLADLAAQQGQLDLGAQELQSQAWTDAQDQASRAAAILPGLQQSYMSPYNLMYQGGLENMQYNQALIDSAMNEWNFYQQLPYNQLANYQNLIQGTYGGSYTGSTTGGGSGGGFLGALGGGLSGYAMGSMMGGTGGMLAGTAIAPFLGPIGAGIGILSMLG
jgi:hypothetical protein